MFEEMLKQLIEGPKAPAPKEKKYEIAEREFLRFLPQRKALGNTAFRRAVIEAIMRETCTGQGAASMHYQRAFDKVKEEAPELVQGLGRQCKPKRKVVTVLDRSRHVLTVTAMLWS